MGSKLLILMLAGFYYFTGTSFCQDKKLDSLLIVLKNSKEDTSKVNTLNDLSYYSWPDGDYNNAIRYANEAIALSKKIGFKKGEGDAYFIMGWGYREQRNYNESLKNYLIALKIRLEVGDKLQIAYSYQYTSSVYDWLENHGESLRYKFQALKLFEELGDKRNTANILQWIGGSYASLGIFPEATKNYLASLKVREEIGDRFGMAQSHNSLGNVYLAQKEYSKALEKFKASLEIFREPGAPDWGLPWCCQAIGEIYESQGEQEAGAGNKPASIKKFNEAMDSYNAAIKAAENVKMNVGKIYVIANTINLGGLFTKLKRYTEAREHLTKGLQMAALLADKGTLKSSYGNLTILDTIQGNYKAAFEHYKMFILYRDSLINEESLRKSESSRMQYEFDKKEDSLNQKQIITQTKLDSQKKQKSFYLAGAGLLVLLSLFVFLNFRNQKKINRLANDAHAKEKAELELQSLRAQLNPHFMFNSLNAIQELILLEENEKSQSYLARFAKLLRMLLENAERPFIPLQREIEFLQLYLSLENLRIPDLQHSIMVDPAIDTEKTMIPNMILQPYIENAIWHGLSHKKSDRKLQIRITKPNRAVQYEIEDNGVGRKKSAELKSLFRKEHKSKGMELLSKRFKLLAKEYGSDIRTEIKDIMSDGETNGTIVIISIPHSFSYKLMGQK